MGGSGRLSFLLVCLACATGIALTDPVAAAGRLALVIGNGAYENAPPLDTPVGDAAEMAATLGRLGFEVDLQTDLDGTAMQNALRDFGYRAPSADVALVFFSGHGISIGGENFLLPVDARLRRERDLLYEALPVGLVLDETAQARGLGLVILDASRENPLAEQLRSNVGVIGAQRIADGIGAIEDLPGETLVAVSSRPGTTSIDPPGERSPFVAALLTHLEEPGLELDFLFRKVRDDVLAATRRRQDPRIYDTLGADPFYFRARPNRPPVVGRIEPLRVRDDAGAVALGLPQPTDPDDDRLTIEVAGLPEHGIVTRGGERVAVGDELDAADLAELRYEPERNYAGEAGMVDLMIDDGKGGMAGARLPIVAISSNRPPIVAAPESFRISAVPLNLPAPIDPDGDDRELTIEITRLPETGVIRDGGRMLKVGDELTPTAFASLFLVTENGVANGVFAFRVRDAKGAASDAEVDIAFRTGVAARAVAANLAPEPTPDPEPAAGDTADDQVSETPSVAAAPPAAAEPPGRTIVAGEGNADGAGEADDDRTALYRTTRMSNIRSEPRVEARRVVTVPADTLLEVTGTADGENWYQVKTEDGQSGYIYFALVRPATMNAIKAKLPTVRSSGEVKTGPDD